MKGLDKRLTILEGTQANSFAHLSDLELEGRMRQIGDELERHGHPLPADWWSAYERGDFRTIDRMIEELRCEILAAA